MRRLIYISLLVFLSIIFINVSAATCSDEEYKEKLEVAKKIKITYQHIQGTSFDIIITNLEKNMLLIDDKKSVFIYGTGEALTLHNYLSGVYTFRVFTDSGNCKDKRIHTLMIEIPRYNTFADTEYCMDNPDFKYCDSWYNGYISLESFSSGIIEYEKNKEEKDRIEVKNSFYNGMADFYKDNKIYILCGGAALILIIGVIVIYKISDRRKIKL